MSPADVDLMLPPNGVDTMTILSNIDSRVQIRIEEPQAIIHQSEPATIRTTTLKSQGVVLPPPLFSTTWWSCTFHTMLINPPSK